MLRDVTADCAGDVAGRIWSIVETGVLDGLGNCEIGDAWLNDGATVLVVNPENAIELGHAEEDAVGQRQSAARNRGSRAARGDLGTRFLAMARARSTRLAARR